MCWWHCPWSRSIEDTTFLTSPLSAISGFNWFDPWSHGAKWLSKRIKSEINNCLPDDNDDRESELFKLRNWKTGRSRNKSPSVTTRGHLKEEPHWNFAIPWRNKNLPWYSSLVIIANISHQISHWFQRMAFSQSSLTVNSLVLNLLIFFAQLEARCRPLEVRSYSLTVTNANAT